MCTVSVSYTLSAVTAVISPPSFLCDISVNLASLASSFGKEMSKIGKRVNLVLDELFLSHFLAQVEFISICIYICIF